MKLILLAVLVALDLVTAMAAEHPLPPFPLPPGFPDHRNSKNCSESRDCAAGLNCCMLPCGQKKCIPPLCELLKGSSKMCPEEVLKTLNISGKPSVFPGFSAGLPDLSSIRNCSQPRDCNLPNKCCQTPYGGKCIPTINYTSPVEGIKEVCPMEFIMDLFVCKNQSGSPMMPGPGFPPPASGFPPAAHPGAPPPCAMGNVGADHLNKEIIMIAEEIKKIIPAKKALVDTVKAKVLVIVREAFDRIQDKIKRGWDALRDALELLRTDKIPQKNLINILTLVEKACPEGKNDTPLDLLRNIDILIDAVKRSQQSALPKGR